MVIREVPDNKWAYKDLLLLADEQEDMIGRYLDRGTMFVLEDGGVRGECVVTDEGGGVLEIKNLAARPRRRGYGSCLIRFLERNYKDRFRILQVGTGDSPETVPFYEACGFTRSRRIPNFFIDHYDRPIIEGGVRLTDMIYLRKRLDG